MKAYERWGGVGRAGWGAANTDYVHRDEIGELVSSILLNGSRKLQITRLFSIPCIISTNEKVHEGCCWGGGTIYPGVETRYENYFQYPLEGLSETSNNQALLIPFIIT